MATEDDRVSLMRDALIFICEGYVSQREKELAEADKYGIPRYHEEYSNAQLMRLRARAAVLQGVIRDLKDVIHDPIYQPNPFYQLVDSPEGSED
jgi:hypothetical protein